MSIQRYTLNYGLSHGECSAEFLKDPDGEWVKAEDLPGWQPIETAPKAGHIIGHWRGYKRPCVMWWNVADGAWESWADRKETPSHWMPLPEPPK